MDILEQNSLVGKILETLPFRLTMWGQTLWASLLILVYLMVRPLPHQSSKTFGYVAHLIFALPFFALSGLFLLNDTNYLHVALHGGEHLPLKYRFAATWAAREGPLLLWFGWMGLLAMMYRHQLNGERDDTRSLRLRFHYGMMILLLLISMALDPFEKIEGQINSAGLNPLLQTDLMVIHPPLIFLAYAYCLLLSSIGLSVMLTREEQPIQQRFVHVLRPAFFITTLGIGLGGLWAYLILDWGGYWAWDPVETGSFLPWLVLAMMVHLRTRPGHVDNHLWIGASFAAGFTAIFATLVTRAGGVWAASVHTFVQDDKALTSNDVFFRFMTLKETDVSLEIMSYVMMCLLYLGAWLTLLRLKQHSETPLQPIQFAFLTPIVLALIGFALGDWVYATLPPIAYLFLGIVPMMLTYSTQQLKEKRELLLLLYCVVCFIVVDDVMLAAVYICFIVAMQYEPLRTKWGWAMAGISLSLAAAWSNMISIYQAGVMLVFFMHPWLLSPEEEQGRQNNTRHVLHPKFALWGSVVITGIYLILTWAILLSSVDSINFEAHELYGAPFLFAIGCAYFMYMGRHLDQHIQYGGLAAVVIFSIVGAILFPHSWGLDADHSISEIVDRGHLAWVILPMTLTVTPFVVHEIVNQINKSKRTLRPLFTIPIKAHIVHFGLILLIIGHVFTTTLVD
ncbi:MAG: cytochrome c biogenesis protein CcsA, partial [Candidatus Poseidoniaceae archaeon]